MRLLFLLCIMWPTISSGQLKFNSRGTDTLLLGTKMDFYRVDDILHKDISEIELGIFLINGKIDLDSSDKKNNIFSVEKIYCQTKAGEITTLFFVLKDTASLLNKRLHELYENPTEIIKEIIESSEEGREKNLIWNFDDYSIYYLPSLARHSKILIVNNKGVPFLRNFTQ